MCEMFSFLPCAKLNNKQNLFHRLGPDPIHGVARLRRHSGLEHFLPHPGHGHPKAADVMALHPGDLHRAKGVGAVTSSP